MKRLLLLTTVALTSVFVVAKEIKLDEKYFTIGEVKVELLEDVKLDGINRSISSSTVPSPAELPKPPEPTQPPSPPQLPQPVDISQTLNNINAVLDTIDRIVNLAEKIWSIIERNQPVAEINVKYANAVPYGIQHWTQLQGWSKPKTVKYSFVAKNAYGMRVVKVVYQVHFTYGGNYQGKGKFLTGVTAEPISVETAWGYKVSLTAEVPDSTIANVGTHDDPIASMQLQLKWKIHTVIKDLEQKAIYYLDGTGKIKEIATPFKKSSEIKSIKVEPVEVTTDNFLPVVDKIKSADFYSY